MNRRTLLIANLKSELWIAKVTRQHEMKYQPPQPPQEVKNVPINQPPPQPPEAPQTGLGQPPVA